MLERLAPQARGPRQGALAWAPVLEQPALLVARQAQGLRGTLAALDDSVAAMDRRAQEHPRVAANRVLRLAVQLGRVPRLHVPVDRAVVALQSATLGGLPVPAVRLARLARLQVARPRVVEDLLVLRLVVQLARRPRQRRRAPPGHPRLWGTDALLNNRPPLSVRLAGPAVLARGCARLQSKPVRPLRAAKSK
jgi:hypothetical protein